MLLDTGQTLPLPTQILIAVTSDAFKKYWMGRARSGSRPISFVFERVYHNARTAGDSSSTSFLAAHLPSWSATLLRKQAVSRFTQDALDAPARVACRSSQSLEITRKVVQNRVIADATEEIRVRILEGTDISSPLKASGAFPPVVGLYGGRSASNPASSSRCSSASREAYDEEIQISTERLTSILEPLMIVAPGGRGGLHRHLDRSARS